MAPSPRAGPPRPPRFFGARIWPKPDDEPVVVRFRRRALRGASVLAGGRSCGLSCHGIFLLILFRFHCFGRSFSTFPDAGPRGRLRLPWGRILIHCLGRPSSDPASFLISDIARVSGRVKGGQRGTTPRRPVLRASRNPMPFEVFRRHQRKLLAIFAILAMFGFVVSDSLPRLLSSNYSRPGPEGHRALRQVGLPEPAQRAGAAAKPGELVHVGAVPVHVPRGLRRARSSATWSTP